MSAGAIRGLARLRFLEKEKEAEVFEFLKSLTEYGNPHILENVRAAAIASLADFASDLSKKRKTIAIKTFVDLLRESKSGIKVLYSFSSVTCIFLALSLSLSRSLSLSLSRSLSLSFFSHSPSLFLSLALFLSLSLSLSLTLLSPLPFLLTLLPLPLVYLLL